MRPPPLAPPSPHVLRHAYCLWAGVLGGHRVQLGDKLGVEVHLYNTVPQRFTNSDGTVNLHRCPAMARQEVTGSRHTHTAAPSGHSSTSQCICTFNMFSSVKQNVSVLQYLCTAAHLLVQLLQLQGVQPRLLLLMAVQDHWPPPPLPCSRHGRIPGRRSCCYQTGRCRRRLVVDDVVGEIRNRHEGWRRG